MCRSKRRRLAGEDQTPHCTLLFFLSFCCRRRTHSSPRPMAAVAVAAPFLPTPAHPRPAQLLASMALPLSHQIPSLSPDSTPALRPPSQMRPVVPPLLPFRAAAVRRGGARPSHIAMASCGALLPRPRPPHLDDPSSLFETHMLTRSAAEQRKQHNCILPNFLQRIRSSVQA